ncbi:DUF5906 domain-containing protein [Mesorhizobium sp.]|uniref:DUF5906 domain-containing protein n=1 Tax=Mesorhizobium sp. TaxID=1871066 RepID=UPI000FE975D0|nr:DUF5906 domain-containing protein [Mesorhizobium sp.]RWO46330.1 MAG: hypothetical protein EOS13_26880 [Mesorhizobium sp.]
MSNNVKTATTTETPSASIHPFKPARIARQLLAMLGDPDTVTLFHRDNEGKRAGVVTKPVADIAAAIHEARDLAGRRHVLAALTGLRLAFEDKARANAAVDRLDASYVIHGPDNGIHLVYLMMSADRLATLLDELQDDDDGAYVADDVPLAYGEYGLHEDDLAALEGGKDFRVCEMEEFEAAFLSDEGNEPESRADETQTDRVTTSIEDALAAGKPFFDATVTGELVPGVLDHSFVGSKLHSQTDWKAENVFADVRRLYRHVAEHKVSDNKKGPGITACHLAKDKETGRVRRKKRNVESNGAFMFDFDGGQTTDEILGKFEALEATFGAYSSYNHLKTEGVHKLRVILPFETPFIPDQYGDRENRAAAVWRSSLDAFCEKHCLDLDRNARDVTRFMNSPRHPEGGQFFSRIHLGSLYKMEVVLPEERPIAKIAKKAGVTLAYDLNGEAYVAEGNGVEFFLSLIGDGDGLLGFHNPIYRVLCSYLSPSNEGPDAEAGPIVQRLRQVIEEAEKGPGREQSEIDRYMSDDYLSAEVENARTFIRERQEADEAAKQAQAEILAEAFEIAKKMTKLTPDEEVQTLLQKLVAVSEREAERVIAEVKKLTGTPIGCLREDYRNLRTKQAKGKARSPYQFETVEAGIAALNKEIAIVERGTDVMIIQKREEQDGWKTIRAAETVFAPWEIGTGSDMEPLFPLWRKSHLRDYRTDVVFNPYRHGAIDPTPSEHYNLYKGLGIEPGMSDWMSYQRHVFHIVCNGDMRLFRFYMSWMADLFQNPETKPGTALMVRGLKGTGKSIFTVPLQQIFGLRHSVKVSNRKHLTGNFNGQMAGKMLVIGEESSWGGDKEADSSLKDQITSDTMLLENKFADPVPMRDYRRFIIISNAKSVVRATPDERRYAATVVSDARIGDKAYFDTLAAEIYVGKTAPAMLHDLLNLDVTVDLRNPPKTAALADQIINALPADERWIRGVLLSGSFTGADGVDLLDERTAEKWLTEPIKVTKEMVRESYRSAVKPYDGPADPGTIGKFFVSKFRGTDAEIDDTRPGRAGRDYVLPPLPEMITAYEREWTPLNPETIEDENDFIRVVNRNDPDECSRVETSADDFINDFFRR